MLHTEIPTTFLSHAADVLAATTGGLSGSKIVEICNAYAIDFNVAIPFPEYPFPMNTGNKRSVLRENIKAFNTSQQYRIIKEITELEQFKGNNEAKDLRIKLVTRYGHLNNGNEETEINQTLIEETKHWLKDYPDSLKVHEDALNKFNNQIYERNLLDDLRLSLELLLKAVLDNSKSLENQIEIIRPFIKSKNGSIELNNMFLKLIDYYCKYQNSYVKHNDAVIENEIEIIFEITCSFMKFIARLK